MNDTKLKQTAFSFESAPEMGRDDFMVSNCNREAFSIVDSWPNWVANGLVVYGPKGSGKTHLAHLWAEKVNSLSAKPTKILFYDSCRVNMKNLERICDSGNAIVLENLNENVDEEALFHLFNHFSLNKKYMLWTAQKSPARTEFSLKDFQSRINMLPAVEIKEPDDIMLRALVVKLFDDRQLMISPDILEYIVNNTERSFAYVENLVKEIDELSLAYKTTVNYKVIKEALQNLNSAENSEPDLFFDYERP